MKKAIAILAAVAAIAACSVSPNTEREDTQRVQDQQAHYAKVQPIPYFDFSMDRDTLIQIYKAKNEARQTHSVVTSQGTGAVLWECPSIGFPIPVDTQLTNPVQMIRDPWVSGSQVVEQPEPNGLFSSKNTDATYVQCVAPDGTVSPVYTEQKVTTFPFPVKIVDGQIVRDGEASITLDIKSGSEGVAPAASPAP